MRGSTSKSLPLTVTARIHRLILKEYNKSTISVRLKQRLQIILDGISGESTYQTTQKFGIKYPTIKKWRDRWNESIAILIEASQTGIGSKSLKDHELLAMIKEILKDKQRSGKPKRITMDQKEQIRALACTSPLDHGIQMSRWTHEMLAHVCKSNKIVDKLSSRYVGTLLKKTQ